MTQPSAIGPANSAAVLEKVVIGGDLKDLSPAERMTYYRAVCESLGLNPLTRPFEYANLQGKLVLYARKDCAEQLRTQRGISCQIVDTKRVEDVWIVTARATDKNGRMDEATGAVAIGGLKGDNLANALMKAETKAKRRVTLSIAGLGIVDESELETIPGARSYTEADLNVTGGRVAPLGTEPGRIIAPPAPPKRIEPSPDDLEAKPVEEGVPLSTVPTLEELLALGTRKGIFLRTVVKEELGKDGFHQLTDSDRIFLYGQLSEMPDKPTRR